MDFFLSAKKKSQKVIILQTEIKIKLKLNYYH